MLLKTETYKIQNKLSEYCRNGKLIEIKGAVTDRLPHYRRLVFNVVKDAVENTYPIAHKYINKNIWKEICHDFFTNHKCKDPQVWRMPKEFVEYCKNRQFAEQYNLPFLNDLLYFEWLEVEMYMMEDKDSPLYNDSDNWLTKKNSRKS
jgi:hypothetical protein